MLNMLNIFPGGNQQNVFANWKKAIEKEVGAHEKADAFTRAFDEEAMEELKKENVAFSFVLGKVKLGRVGWGSKKSQLSP